MIPNWLLCRPEVSAGAKLTYARLCQFSGRDGLCFPRQTTLAAELGVSDRAVRNYLRELEEFQLVEVDQPGLQQSNRYAFLAHPWINDGSGAAAGLPDRQGSSAPDRNGSSGPDRQDSSGPTGEEIQGEEIQRHTRSAGSSIPRSLEEVEAVASMHGIVPEAARVFYHEREANGWLNRHGHPLRNWQSALKAYGEKWRAVDHQRAAVAAVRSPARTSRRGAFATVAPAEAFTSTQI
jgi:hypothetical protein